MYLERYSVFNKITREALEHVGIYPDLRPQHTFGEEYQKVNEIIRDIASKNNHSLWQMDSVWWDIVGKEQINKVAELGSEKLRFVDLQDSY